MSLSRIHLVLCSVVLLAACDATSINLAVSPGAPATPASATTTVGPAGGTAASADGGLVLTFPAGALASTTDIVITALDADEADAQYAPAVIRAAYELGPDGLTFDAPVAARLTLPGNPVVDAQTLAIAPVMLATLNADGGELIQTVRMDVDTRRAGITVEGEITHFSRLVGFLASELRVGESTAQATGRVVYRIDGVPFGEDPPIEPGETRVVRARIDNESGEDGARVVPASPSFRPNASPEPAFDVFAPEQRGQILPMPEGEPQRFARDIQYICRQAQSGVFLAQVRAAVSPAFTVAEALSIGILNETGRSDQSLVRIDANVRAPVNCQQATSGGGDPPAITTGVFNMPGNLTRPEDVRLIGPPSDAQIAAFGAFAAVTIAIFSGEQGLVATDLSTGEVVRDFTSEFSAPSFGAAVASRPNPGPDSPAVIVETGPVGGLVRAFNPAFDDFPNGGQSLSGSVFDATATGGGLVTDQLVYADGTGVGLVTYSETDNTYGRNDDVVVGTGGFDGRDVVSAVQRNIDGPVLAITRGEMSYVYLAGLDAPAVEIAEIGADARKLRCAGEVCVATLFGDDAIQPMLWDGMNAPSVPDGGQFPVGDGPVNTSLFPLPDGTLRVATPGFNDDSVTLTVLDDAGGLVSFRRFPLPDACRNPAHAEQIVNPDDADDPLLVVTCFGSDRYVITNRAELEAANPLQ